MSFIIFLHLNTIILLANTLLFISIKASGQEFIWAIRTPAGEKEEWMPEGFEERTRGKGMIIRGWAPQVLILDHGSVGAFVTHCGWNSMLEGVCAGVPMVTWPVFAEQFINEKLVTDILRTGVGMGSKEGKRSGSDGVKREAVAEAIKKVMVGEESGEMRSRAKALKEKARVAVEEAPGNGRRDRSFQEFIWAIRTPAWEKEEWMPEGFKERTRGKGLIIREGGPASADSQPRINGCIRDTLRVELHAGRGVCRGAHGHLDGLREAIHQREAGDRPNGCGGGVQGVEEIRK
ncbi:unnamed protein product [Cuscuta campestris]|uniref:Uncharacterized protein n=1 Tax=Cuscuta campestris TaxID=132261 RepID=A0A484KIK0_9ASTE|nr:unnamed protein product [Cuscuta campestris]